MTNNETNPNQDAAPQYSIGEIMELLEKDESEVRKLIKKAGGVIDENVNNPNERISYEAYCKLWVSQINRREGKLLGTLLVGGTENWLGKLLGSRK